MIKFVLIDVFGGLAGITVIAAYLSSRIRKQKKDALIDAKFIGGPLDNKTKQIHFAPVYVYQDPKLQYAGAVYRYEGDGLYSFDDYAPSTP